MLMAGSLASLDPAALALASDAGEYDKVIREIEDAQRSEDLPAVNKLAERAKQLRGKLAGVPDGPDRMERFDGSEPPITKREVAIAFTPYAKEILKRKWWKVGDDPTQATRPLRDLASVVLGCTLAARAECEGSDKLTQLARDGGDYLVWAQQQGGKGVFPFPASSGAGGQAFGVANKLLRSAESSGRTSDVVANGWIVDDLGEGGLQYDNGNCGVALLELYRLTGDKKYLRSAEEAAKWAMSQPVVPNWNYNSFSVYLLAELGRETGNDVYRQAAIKKAQLGIYPGQLTAGQNRGRWFDAHNARPEYHYILTRGLVALVAALAPETPDHGQAKESLQLALRARDGELAKGSIVNVESALEALVLLQQYSSGSDQKIGAATDAKALDMVGGYCVRKARDGRLPVAPGAWGRYLDYSRDRLLTKDVGGKGGAAVGAEAATR